MKLKQMFAVAIIILTVFACQKAETNVEKSEAQMEKETPLNSHKVTVAEVIDGKTYTYLRVMDNDVEEWIAISKRDTKVGEVLYFNDALEMENFESKELAKTFDKILFVSAINNEPVMNTRMMAGEDAQPQTPISIEAPKEGISISELYKNRDSYNGKEVIVKGKIIKLNKQIMGRNWFHIQDGSSSDKKIDLTVTTTEDVKLGEVVTVKGTIAIEKDFGAGYLYDVIMESASVVTSKNM